jgi:outer membrane protein TolC
MRRLLALTLAYICLQAVVSQSLIVNAQMNLPPPSAQSGLATDLTLPAAVDIALRTNPMVRATDSGRLIADAQLNEARAGKYPQLQVSETFTRSNNPVFVFGSLLEQGRFTASNFDLNALNDPGALTNVRTAVTLRLPVFDQRQTSTRIAQARIGREQADTQIDLVAQRIRFEVIKAYYGVLLARARVEVALEAVKMAQADIKRTRDLFETGVIVHADLLAAEVQLSEFRQQQIEAESELVTAQAALNTALGIPIEQARNVSGQLLERSFNVEGREELIRQALSSRPDYKRAALSVRSAGEQRRGARGERLPRVDTFASFGYSGRSPVTGSSDYMIGASVSYNLFDKGRSARMDRARAAEGMASAETEQLANQIRFEVVSAEQRFLSARERLKVVARMIDQASEALRIVQDRYQEGLTTITEVLRAETALVRTQQSVLAARYDIYVGYANLLLATGRLTDVQAFVS